MSTQTVSKTKRTYWLWIAIGLAFMLVFPKLPPMDPITPTGMTLLGVFLGMIILWSAVNSIWPSVMGLLLVSFSGVVPDAQGYAAVKTVFLNAFGNETTLFIVFGMVLFGGLDYLGITPYLAKFLLSRKFMEGRPYVILAVIFTTSYLLSGLTVALVSMFLLWPIAIDICAKLGYKKGDKIFYILICGIYLAATLGQPMLPFKSASYILVSAYQNGTGNMVNYAAYIFVDVVMYCLVMGLFLLFLKYIVKPDVSRLKSLKTDDISKEELPPMNFAQKTMVFVTVFVMVVLLIPGICPKSWAIVKFLSSIGSLGITVIALAFVMILPYQGKPVFDFKGVAKKSFSWDIFCLVAAAIYVCGQITNDATGIKPWIVQTLQPVLGGKPEIVFVALLLAVAIITTNFANNAGMGLVLLPIIISFQQQYSGISLTALYMCVAMIVFNALLTPAASPYCAMLHGRRDLVSYKEIMTLFVPVFFIAYICWVLVGYRLCALVF